MAVRAQSGAEEVHNPDKRRSQRTIIAHWNGEAVADDEVSERDEQSAANANDGEPVRPRSPALLAATSATRERTVPFRAIPIARTAEYAAVALLRRAAHT